MNVYFDHNATTPLDERVLTAMLPHLRDQFGNAASRHAPGRSARAAIDTAREQVAALVGAHPGQVVFTAGGTEADNMALKGLSACRRGRLLYSAIEHPAVLETAEAMDVPSATIAVDGQGRVDLADLDRQLGTGDVAVVAVMVANNETGAIQPVAEVSDRVRAAGALLHVDGVQGAGKLAMRYADTGAHTLAISSHKIYGPKGVGALVLDKRVDIRPLLHGGGHEGGLRGGTENTAAIVGFGAAAELAKAERASRHEHTAGLRDRLQAGLAAALPEAVIFAAEAERLPNTLQFAVPGFEGESLLMALDQFGFAVSSGSACASGSGEPSHVLLAMGVDPVVARGAIRVSLGKDNTADEIDRFLAVLPQVARSQSMPGLNPAVMGA
ncbi:cysteine desulfurase family protein [Spectribacter hydrogenoxidans]|uniref:Cysteine desulfurase family protein n=1 Tax=Spectribacter hydrogenoxidans TaxID=3075608 RepID=A0ABU3BYH8_9GAMM|nr:cysteine desulfurase family protein [Salinisphaera sp. W335]MDT0634364.1 cysteine desulfurase family protein [Salinisphaera sp. W335]